MQKYPLLLIVLSTTLNATPIPTQDRFSVIQEIKDGCLKSQINAPENGDVPLAVIHQYCDCTSESAANSLTAEDVDAMNSGNPSPGAQKIAQAYAYCR
jgi:hypothetical protein